MKYNTRPRSESFNHIGGQAWIKKPMTIPKPLTNAKNPMSNELQPLPQCMAPNQRLIWSPQTSASGKKYIKVMTDTFSKLAELVALPNKEAKQ